ncbi:hypothetical protein [Sphingomonas solaris]|uniref:Uncharacterized protein n=1 Tax=Alterirhizorhabdus solaris TaxID=2529389 RepID=A0A558R6I9_9SPHN|nr:hypothetical protein [Sphingomonas solaris]TVV74997.1 hypothetical protein FOY91_08445 [Sphingomonas solaris]
MRPLPLLAAALLAALATAPADAGRKRDDLSDLTPIPGAKPESCIPLAGLRESRVRNDSTIDFYGSGKRIWRSTLPYSCPQLGFERAFSYATSLSQLCSSDIITVLNRAGGGLVRGAGCGLGPFQPMQKAR